MHVPAGRLFRRSRQLRNLAERQIFLNPQVKHQPRQLGKFFHRGFHQRRLLSRLQMPVEWGGYGRRLLSQRFGPGTFAFALLVKEGVGRDPEQPCPHVRAGFKGVEPIERPQECFLRQVLRRVNSAAQRLRQAKDGIPVFVHHCREIDLGGRGARRFGGQRIILLRSEFQRVESRFVRQRWAIFP